MLSAFHGSRDVFAAGGRICISILPVVDLQKGQVGLCCNLPFLVFCGIRVLKRQPTGSGSLKLWGTEGSQTSASHHEMLKEPRAHDVGGVFGQNPPLVFGLFIFTVQQGRKVQVYLENKNQEGGESG